MESIRQKKKISKRHTLWCLMILPEETTVS